MIVGGSTVSMHAIAYRGRKPWNVSGAWTENEVSWIVATMSVFANQAVWLAQPRLPCRTSRAP